MTGPGRGTPAGSAGRPARRLLPDRIVQVLFFALLAAAGCEAAPPFDPEPPDPAAAVPGAAAPRRVVPWGPWHELWRHQADGQVTAPPAADAQRLYVASWDHRLTALDRATGRPDWDLELTARTLAPPVLAGGILADLNAHQTLYLVDAAAGRITRELRTGWWFPRQAPVFAGGRVAAVSDKGQVTVWTAGEENGRPAGWECWSVELEAPPVGPPMACGGTLWTCDHFRGFRGWTLADGSPRPVDFGMKEYPHQAVPCGENAVVSYSASVRWFDLKAGAVSATRRIGAAYPGPIALRSTGAGTAVIWCGKTWVLWVEPAPGAGGTGVEARAIDDPPAGGEAPKEEAGKEPSPAGAGSFPWACDGEEGVLWAAASARGGAVCEAWRPSCGADPAPQRIEFESPVTMIDCVAPDLMVVGLQDGTLAAFTRDRRKDEGAGSRR